MFEAVKEWFGLKPNVVIPTREDPAYVFKLPHGRFRVMENGRLSGRVAAWCPISRTSYEFVPEGRRICNCLDAIDGDYASLPIVEMPPLSRGLGRLLQAGTSRILDTEFLEDPKNGEVTWTGDGGPRNSFGV